MPSADPPVEGQPADPSSAIKRKADIDEIEVNLEAPEPPSKRARRALKKGKVLPKKPSSDDEGENEDGDDKDGDKAGKKPRSEHSVWIGNLPFFVTAAQLRTWIIENSGDVVTSEMITRIKLPTKKEPRGAKGEKKEKPENKGFAYVDFSDLGGKVAAIALSENDIGGRRLLIKDATSFEGRPQREPEDAEGDEAKGKEAGEKDDSNASRKVFVGNMSFKTTEDDLKRNFEKCGEIEWVKLATFEDSGKCKGFGWVKFREPEAAAWAVKGFIKIKEQVETEEDFKAADDEGEAPATESEQKRFKSRKWWVNRMLGRELKLELAEDDQLRYRKRFGKDRKREEDGEAKAPRGDRRDRQNGDAENRAERRERRPRDREPKPLKEATDIQTAKLTGAVVKHTGTKMTFD